ncbi:hypothetical protein LUD75_03420 [Epilithonimonas sp. JDS]|uniref:hypothetical protein n=1 Tax=Epilithonimonas sp. JDS TaxID=2902797 RepID=UPI001E52079C|nr:hypothetical protein [Epilithonimonas sp. JDS]MCD9853736.1 hypothetical protein [Epilithonimonas sp. JDS]
MFDLLKVRTYEQEIINTVYDSIKNEYRVTKDLPYLKEYQNKGITIAFQKQNNRECLYVTFSPHKQVNENIHNATPLALQEAQDNIISTLANIKIDRNDFSKFKITRLEIGVNYKCELPLDIVFKSFLMFQTALFKTHKNYTHYKFADSGYRKNTYNNSRSPYQTFKHYIKSAQRDHNGISNADNGYCDDEVMRTEIKTERSGKVKEIGFDTLADLYRDNALECSINFLKKNLEKVFVFNPKEIDKKKLKSVPMQKHFYQMTTPKYWENINGKKLTSAKSKWNELPKSYDTKNIITNAILEAIKTQNNPATTKKNRATLHKGKTTDRKTANTTIYGNSQQNKYYHISLDVVNSPYFFCTVTGLDISMQREGLRHLYQNNRRRFYQIRDRFMPIEFTSKTLEEQIVRIESNIRHTHDNKALCQRLMQERNYHPAQAQFNFQY